jgi:hypothetical protein
MIPFYRLILRRALEISWKNKWIWVLAFFAAFLGQGGAYEFLVRVFNNLFNGQSLFYTIQDFANSSIFGMLSWGNLQSLWVNDLSTFSYGVFSLLLALCVLAVIVTLSIISQAGFIRGAISLDNNKKTTIRKSFHEGLTHFWPVFWINIITKIILIGVLMLLAYLVSLLIMGNIIVDLILLVLIFVIFIVFGITIYFLTIYGTAFIVLKNKKTLESLKMAWHLFRKHILVNLEMGLLLFIINVLFGLVFMISLFIVLAPFVLLYIMMLMGGYVFGLSILSIIMTIIIFGSIIVLGSFYNSFQLSAWVILFEELAVTGGKSKIIRLFDHFKNRKKRKK